MKLYLYTFSNRVFYILGLKQSIGVFFKALEFIVESLRKENEYYSDQRLKWLKDLYLNLFYDNPNKRFQAPTPMQALLAFGGRQFNYNTLEHNFYSSVNNLINNCQSTNNNNNNNAINKSRSSSGNNASANVMFDLANGLDSNQKDETDTTQIRFQLANNGDIFTKAESKCFLKYFLR